MSRYFPHTAYAEDQPLLHAILTTHVLTRGVTTSTVVGLVATSARQLVRRGGPRPSLVHVSATSILVGVPLTAVALAARMYGRQPIEWHDRSWRLMENKGQLETDDWTYGGMAAGAVVAAARVGFAWRTLLGGAGLGSVVGTLGYLAWRHGLNGGKFPEKKGEDL